MTGTGSTFRAWLSRAEEWNPSSWLIGPIVALLGWQVAFQTPIPGLDESWWAGLYMAAHDGKQFGTEIVFTYGPLGILREPWLFFPGSLSLIPYLYDAVIFTAFCIALVAVLRRRVGWVPAALISLLILLLVEQTETTVALVMFASILIIERRPNDRTLMIYAIAGGILAGAEMLAKLSAGPVVVVVLLIGLIGARARPAQLAAFFASMVASSIGCWLLTGQSIGNLPDFVSNSIPIVTGYSDAMSLYDQSPVINLVFVVVTAIATVVWTLEGRYKDRRADLAAGAIALVVTFAFYKQAVIRIDGFHMAAFFALVSLLWVAIPPRRGLLPVSLVGMTIFAIVASLYWASEKPAPGLNPIENLRSFVSDARTALDPGRQERLIDRSREQLEDFYGLRPDLKAELEDQTVSVAPWETMAAWAYDLNWSPVPVFQNYSAYTSELDRLNTEAIVSPSGPDRILRHIGPNPNYPTRSIDIRLQPWDPPEQSVATLCNFLPVGASRNWQVLARIPGRCGPPIPAGVVESGFGERVAVPRPGRNEVIIARIQGADVDGLERLRSFLFRPKERRVKFGAGSYRLVPGTASDGLMVRAGAHVTEAKGRFSQVPQLKTIELLGTSGELRYDFFRMRVEPVALYTPLLSRSP
ncbi:MAG: hypothetical protein KDB52_10915 [Solirubrobacterales bacterium]|nr:hypothetical protein [Solirubrobacterales bacterium]